MGKTLQEKLASLPPERQARIKAETAQLQAVYMTLKELRRAKDMTQAHLANQLGKSQVTIAQMEKRTDLLLSTLRHYVEAIGGRLDLVVQFPDQAPVILKQLSGETAESDTFLAPTCHDGRALTSSLGIGSLHVRRPAMVNVWRLMAHDDLDQRLTVIRWAKKNERVGIGWDDLGDIRQYETVDQITDAAIEVYHGMGLRNVHRCGAQLWNFCRTMQSQDLVILKTGRWQESVVMRVREQPYEYVLDNEAPPFGLQHQRKVEVTNVDPQALWQKAGGMQPGECIYSALIQCQYPIDPQNLPH